MGQWVRLALLRAMLTRGVALRWGVGRPRNETRIWTRAGPPWCRAPSTATRRSPAIVRVPGSTRGVHIAWTHAVASAIEAVATESGTCQREQDSSTKTES